MALTTFTIALDCTASLISRFPELAVQKQTAKKYIGFSGGSRILKRGFHLYGWRVYVYTSGKLACVNLQHLHKKEGGRAPN